MKYSKFIFLFVIILIVSIGYFTEKHSFKERTFEEDRAEVISEMDVVLRKAVQSGEYRCCIEPPCKMCFLGNWIFEDGRCDCDSLIIQGSWDEVCPECKRGVEEGRCKLEINNCSEI
jgi:hypothetical protein